MPLISCWRKTTIGEGGEGPSAPSPRLLRRGQLDESAAAHHRDVRARLDDVPVRPDADPPQRSFKVLDRGKGLGDPAALRLDVFAARQVRTTDRLGYDQGARVRLGGKLVG